MSTTEMVHVRIDKRTKARAAKALANVTTVAAMQEARHGGLPSFRNVSDLMADLNAED